jgi:aryl-alcohol dehydrogenase-like predicted oxidoreductase
VVLATKAAFHDGDAANVNAGGNGRKHLYQALEGSLRRLGTDFVDLYWLHAWDTVTPVEEVLLTLGDLVRAGKIRYFGFSDVPAWYAVKAATLAVAHAAPGPIALQLEYSLVERSIEREHLPAARECGLGVCAWSPLAGGFLSGKYRRDAAEAGRGRLDAAGWQREKSERDWRVLAALETIGAQLDLPMSSVALAWAAGRPGLTALILGARTPEQLQQNLAARDIVLLPEHLRLLDEASALDDAHPYGLFTPALNRDYLFGGTPVAGWR